MTSIENVEQQLGANEYAFGDLISDQELASQHRTKLNKVGLNVYSSVEEVRRVIEAESDSKDKGLLKWLQNQIKV